MRVMSLMKMPPGDIAQGNCLLKYRRFWERDFMIIRFNWELNLALMERNQRENLLQVLDGIQSYNEREIEVAVEQYFPSNFAVKIDSDELVVFWEPEKLAYRVLRRVDAICVRNFKTGAMRIMSRAEVKGMPKGRLGRRVPNILGILKLITNEIRQAQACADADDSSAAWGYLLNVEKILGRVLLGVWR